jgi:hypothetical protein
MEISKFNDWQITNEEVGLRNISNLAKLHKTCEIYFHKDLDGVTSALAMKGFLKTYYQIECVDCHIIQYGGLEWAVTHHKPENLCVLVDFAHGKPMFHIQSDHHDTQVGAEDTGSTYFKAARSNVEIISDEISFSPQFTTEDIELIKTIDSANFLKYGIKVEDVQNSIFSLDSNVSGKKNRFMMGFVVNRLLLAYKNKRISCKSLDGSREHNNRNILECLVLDSSPSLISMFNNIKHYLKVGKTSDKLGRLATPEEITKNLQDYIERMKNYTFIEDTESGDVTEYEPENWRHRKMLSSGSKVGKGVNFDEEYKIVTQYGAGSMIKPGSYDRYVVFKNNPESDFNCIAWPMGLLQVSCNPYREKKLSSINLGEIAKEILAKYEPTFKKFFVSLESIKRECETSQDWKQMKKIMGEEYEGVGFKYSDLKAFYLDCIYQQKDGKVSNILDKLAEIEIVPVDEVFENIKVVISVGANKYIFDILDSKIKNFILDLASNDIEKYSDKIGDVDSIIRPAPASVVEQKANRRKYRSRNWKSVGDISKKQAGGAKNRIVNLLETTGLIVIPRDKIMVFKKMENESTLSEAMDTTYDRMTEDQKNYLSRLKVPVWELIIRNSGGHPSITNISGFNFLKYNRPALQVGFNTEKYVDVLKMMQEDFVDLLKEKIDVVNEGGTVKYNTKGVELLGQDTNESIVLKFGDFIS